MPVVSVGNVGDLLVLHRVDGFPGVLVPDVDHYLVYPSAGPNRLNPFPKCQDGLPLVPSSELVRVECHDYLAVPCALL